MSSPRNIDFVPVVADRIRSAWLAGERTGARIMLREADILVIEWLRITSHIDLDLVYAVYQEHMRRLTGGTEAER